MADANIGITEVTAVAEARIASVIQSFLIQESVMLNKVMDYSFLAGPGAKSISLPRSGGFSVSSKSENTAAVRDDSNSYSVDTLNLSTHSYVQWLIEDYAAIQAYPDVLSDMILKATKAVAKSVDDAIFTALVAGASTSAPDHVVQYNDTTNEDLDASDILTIRKLLISQNLNPQECYLAITPSQEKNILGISNFISANVYGSAAPIQNGVIGKIFGLNVVVTNSTALTTAEKTIAWHPSALAYAHMFPARLQTQYDLKELGTRYNVDILYGVKVLDGGKRNVTMEQTT